MQALNDGERPRESDAAPRQPPCRRRLRICLAGSGGGHVRQLLDLEPAWSAHEVFFVTESTALTRSLSKTHATCFVTHVALGQGRLGAPLRMAAAAVRNFFQSARIVLSRRPQVVITTGAGSVFFTVLWARALGARVVVIESLARFERLSAFARLARPLAHAGVVQSAALAPLWPGAAVFDPLRALEGRRPPKKPLLFVTVGATLPFDRMVAAVDALRREGAISERVVAQVGVGGLRPEGIECHETLPFERMLSLLCEADIVVCHGGTGSLITALRQGCRVVAMPRLGESGEHYDDHQGEITRAFADRGLIAVAASDSELEQALATVRAREPSMATSDPVALVEHLNGLLSGWAGRGRPGPDRAPHVQPLAD